MFERLTQFAPHVIEYLLLECTMLVHHTVERSALSLSPSNSVGKRNVKTVTSQEVSEPSLYCSTSRFADD